MTTVPAAEHSRWLRTFQPAPNARARLVCLPHAGGAASFFRPLAQALAPDVEVLAVQYPGRQNRFTEECEEDIGALADAVTAALRAHRAAYAVEAPEPQRALPLALFGHSMGAIVAFEVARRLEAGAGDAAGGGVAPVALFASGRRAPSRTRHGETLHQCEDAALIEELRSLNATDSALFEDEEMLSMVIPMIRADYKAIETYRYEPGPPLRCPVTVLLGEGDPKATEEEAADWRRHTAGAFEFRTYPGGHFFLTEHQDEVVEAITELLPPR